MTIVKVQLDLTDEYESLFWFVYAKTRKMSRIELSGTVPLENNLRSTSSIIITDAYNLASYVWWEYLTIVKVQLDSTDEYDWIAMIKNHLHGFDIYESG